jgi:hypothetical protein
LQVLLFSKFLLFDIQCKKPLGIKTNTPGGTRTKKELRLGLR